MRPGCKVGPKRPDDILWQDKASKQIKNLSQYSNRVVTDGAENSNKKTGRKSWRNKTVHATAKDLVERAFLAEVAAEEVFEQE